MAARPSFESINLFLFDCAIHGMGVHNYENERLSGEEHFITQILPLYVMDESSSVTFDIGANEGSYSRLLASRFPYMHIYACEPNPRTFELLSRNAGPNVTAINKGLGSVSSKMTLYDRENASCGAQHATLYRDVIVDVHKAVPVGVDVEVTTFDMLVEDLAITKAVTLLKIDTEGHELEVLKGARRMLNLSLIDVIFIEFNEMNLVSRVFFRDFRQLLHGFTPYRLLPNGAIRVQERALYTELFAFQNFVFINDRFCPDHRMRPTVKGTGLRTAVELPESAMVQ